MKRLIKILNNSKFTSYATLIAIVIYSIIVSISNSAQFDSFSAYLNRSSEPHPIGPTFQAAYNKELFIRIAQNYTSGISSATSYSGLIDSLYLRVISFFTGCIPITLDPEFADPTLQWFLVIKRGVFNIVCIVIIFLLLNKAYDSSYLLGIILAAFVYSISSSIFQIGIDSETCMSMMLIFSIFVFQLKKMYKASWLTGCLIGAIAPVKLTVMLFVPLALNSAKSLIMFIIVSLSLMLGIFRSSFDLIAATFNILQNASTPMGHGNLTVPELVVWNLKFICTWNKWIISIIPIAILGLIALLRRINRKNVFNFIVFFLVIGLFIVAKNSQARYFLGLFGIIHILSFLGIMSIVRVFENKFPIKTGVNVISLLIFIVVVSDYFPYREINIMAQKINNVKDYFSNKKMNMSKGEIELLNIVKGNRYTYIDHRIRANVYTYPFDQYNSKFEVIDLINDFEEIQPGATLATIAYSLNKDDLREMGLMSMGDLEEEIKKQDNFVPVSLLKRFQNTRISLNYGEGLDIVTYKPESRPLKFEILKIEVGKQYVLPTTFFNIKGLYQQEWGSLISSVDYQYSRSFSLSKILRFEKGKYLFRIICSSNFRDKNSILVIKMNNQVIKKMPLDTSENLLRNSRLPEIVKKIFRYWRNKYYALDTDFEFAIPQDGMYEIKIQIISCAKRGTVRFNDVIIIPR